MTVKPPGNFYHIETHYIELANALSTTQRLLSLQLHTIMCFSMVIGLHGAYSGIKPFRLLSYQQHHRRQQLSTPYWTDLLSHRQDNSHRITSTCALKPTGYSGSVSIYSITRCCLSSTLSFAPDLWEIKRPTYPISLASRYDYSWWR